MTNLRHILTAVAALLLATPAPVLALGDACDDLWFTRNQIMDRAGYCFGSNLGRAVFDNAGCLGKDVAVSPADRRKVSEIQSQEQALECRVNTRQTRLDVPDINLRRALIDLPIADGLESACLGYQGPPLALQAGHYDSAPRIGAVERGVTVHYAHYGGPEGWSYVLTHDGSGRILAGGWLRNPPRMDCDQWAG
ncbi:MAG: DUF4453 domain-containing protein [Pseudomonadota bacterium]